MDAIPHDFIRSCFMNLQFRSLFENLHFDPDFPENHNVRLKSDKRQQLEIYKDDRWKVTPFHSGLAEIINRLSVIFDSFHRKYNHEVLEDMNQHELDVLLDELTEISKVSKRSEGIRQELLCVLEENRNALTIV